MQFQLTHDVGTVGFNGLDADTQSGSDFSGSVSLNKQFDDFSLARSEAVGDQLWSFPDTSARIEITQNQFCRMRSKEPFVLGYGLNSNEEIVIRVRFQDISVGPGFDNLADQLIGIVHRQNQNFSIRRFRSDS